MSPCSKALFPQDILWVPISQDINKRYLKTRVVVRQFGVSMGEMKLPAFLTEELLCGFSMLMSIVNTQGVTQFVVFPQVI